MATHSEALIEAHAEGNRNRRGRRTVTSRDLMGDGNEIIIQHVGAEYRLMITKQAKLILTK